LIAEREGLPVMVSGKEQIVKRVRTFEKSVKNPVAIKPHRDQKAGAEHKHWLWVKNEVTPLMAIYENEKGKAFALCFQPIGVDPLDARPPRTRRTLGQYTPANIPTPSARVSTWWSERANHTS
jgi:hypothetical protein